MRERRLYPVDGGRGQADLASLPHDIGAEKAVLGAMLAGGGIAVLATDIEADDFLRPQHGELFEHLLAMLNGDEPIDAVTVRAWLDLHGWPAGWEAINLFELLDATPTAANGPYYAKIVRRHALVREGLEAAEQARQSLLAAEVDVADVMGRLAARAAAIGDGSDVRPDTGPQGAADQVALVRERATAKARQRVAEEVAEAAFAEPELGPTLLSDLLATPPATKRWTIEGLHRTGSNRLLTAQYKTGKTTTVLNEIRSLVDGWPLYERFEVEQITDGSVVFFNYEVDADQIREWFGELAIRNTDRVHVFNLRGIRMSLTSEKGMATAVRWLADLGARYWVIDPYIRALSSCGLSENSNDDVARFTDTVDEIKRLAGVPDLLIASHTGRGEMAAGEERARGATRLDDWADVRHVLVRGKEDDRDSRYMYAEGRDVDIEEFRLDFDPENRRLVAEGGSRANRESGVVVEDVIEAVAANPGTTGNGVAVIVPHTKSRVLKALKEGERLKRIYGIDGSNRARYYHLTGTGPRAVGGQVVSND